MTDHCPTSDGDGVKKKRRRIAITLEMKGTIIRLSESGMSNTKIRKQLGLPRTTVQTIIKHKQRISAEISNAGSLQSTILRQRCGLIAEMEKLLILWIQDETLHNDAPVTFTRIRAKALSLFEMVKYRQSDGSKDEKFIASNGWYNRFKARHALHNTKVESKLDTAVNCDVNFSKRLTEIIEEGNYCLQQVFGIQETGLYWKKMPQSTFIAQEEEAMPGFRAGKDRLTLLLGSNVDGDFKLKPLLVYHSENPVALHGYVKGKLPVIWKSNERAAITGVLFEEWFTDYFVPAVKSYCEQNSLVFKALLLLDRTPGYPSHIVDADPNVKVEFLPLRSDFQPTNQGVVPSFLAYYLRQTFAQVIKATDRENGPCVKEFWEGYNILNAVKNIGESWKEVKESNLSCIWQKLYPDYIYGFQIEDQLSEVIGDVVKMAGQLQLDVQVDDVLELIESHSQVLSSEDFVLLQKKKKAEEHFQITEDSLGTMTVRQMNEAFKHLESAMSIFEKMDPNLERSTMINNVISNAIVPYRDIYNEKKKKINT